MQIKRVRVAVLAGLLAVLFHIHLAGSPGGTLLDAIRRDDAAAVRVLLRTNADVNASDAGGATALMHAALLAGPPGGSPPARRRRWSEHRQPIRRHRAHVGRVATGERPASAPARRQRECARQQRMVGAGRGDTARPARVDADAAGRRRRHRLARRASTGADRVVPSQQPRGSPAPARGRPRRRFARRRHRSGAHAGVGRHAQLSPSARCRSGSQGKPADVHDRAAHLLPGGA